MGVKVFIYLYMLFAFALVSVAQPEIYIEQIQSVETGIPIMQGALSNRGNNLAIISRERNLKLFDAVTLTEKKIPPSLSVSIEAVTFSASGNTLVAGATNGQIYVVDFLGASLVKKYSIHKQAVKSLALQDETFLFSTEGDRTAIVTDLSTGSTLGSISKVNDNIGLLAIRTGMKQVAVGLVNGQIGTFAFAKFAPLLTLTDVNNRIISMCYSPDNKYIAAGSVDRNICLWDAETGALKMKYTQKMSVYTIAFDPKMRWLAVSSVDSTIDFYDMALLSKIKTITETDGYTTFLAFSSEENLITATSKGNIKKWKLSIASPDTTNPTIVIEQPILGPAPIKVLGSEYEISGLVYDDVEVISATLNDMPLKLTAPTTADLSKVPANMKSIKRFSAKLVLDSIGLNPFEIKVADKAKHLVSQSGTIQRLSSDNAVEIISPVHDSDVDKFTTSVKFIPWFDVDSYKISVNMVDIVNEQAVEFKVAGDLISEEVPLVGGYNQIQITVRGKNGERFSKAVGVNRKTSILADMNLPSFGDGSKKKRVTGSGPQSWAVVVGVSDYMNPGITSLKYADKDAEAFANFLRRPEGGGYDSDHLRVLLNKDATLANIRDALINFLNQAIDMDLVIIYFAGHGMPDPARPSNMYLLTHDSDPNSLGTTAFPMWDIQTVLARYINAKRVVVFTDACHSGGISVNFATRGLGSTEQNLVNQYLTDLSKTKEGIVVFTASAAGEVSQEFPELGHGVFTYYLLQGMEGKADYNNDYTITINELMQYTEEQVKRKTRGAQNPTRSQTEYDKNLTISIIPH